MSVYVDNFYITGAGNYGRMKMSHMIADSTEELLEMAGKIGVQAKWSQKQGTPHEHFDVCMKARTKAIALGAKSISYRELGEMTYRRNSPPARKDDAGDAPQ